MPIKITISLLQTRNYYNCSHTATGTEVIERNAILFAGPLRH